MCENLMSKVAEILGVQLLEEFYIKLTEERKIKAFIGNSGLNFFNYKTVSDSLRHKYLAKILMGDIEIEKITWEPKEGDKYYAPSLTTKSICIEIWHNETCDHALKALGMVYRSSEEAKAHFAEDYEKLTGKPLSSR